MGPADEPPNPETSTRPSGGFAGTPEFGPTGPAHDSPQQLLEELRAERLRVLRDIAVEKGRSAIGRLRPVAVGSTQDRIELGTLVLQAQEELDIAEVEHRRAMEAIRASAVREAGRILAAARREAAFRAVVADALTTDLSTDEELAAAFVGNRAETGPSGPEGDAGRSAGAVPRTKPRVRQTSGISLTGADDGTTRQARHVDAG